jgi:hypothetical protein
MREHNILAKSYEMMKQEIIYQMAENDVGPELQLLFSLKPGYDKNRYNFQKTNEVAALFSTIADGEIPESYVTIRNKSTKSLQVLSSLDSNVEPMVYPLFYPYGKGGWNMNLMKKNVSIQNVSIRNDDDNNDNENIDNYEISSKRITRNAYIKYKISIRSDEFNPFLHGRRLYQQWIVDNYVKVEKDRIQWCKNNQKQLRADSYQGLIDYMNNTADDMNCQVGKMVILPSTFLGSPRYIMQNYQDTMWIVRVTGKPDLFITMTCNPQ